MSVDSMIVCLQQEIYPQVAETGIHFVTGNSKNTNTYLQQLNPNEI